MGKQKILKQLLVFALFLLSSIQMMRADLLVQVSVTKPGTMKAEILAKPGVTSLADVTALSVSGALNEHDQTAFPDMVNLEILNLKDADFHYMKMYCDDLKKLKTVILPATVTDIAWDAFRRCENLTDLWCYAYIPAGRRMMPDQTNLTIHVPDYSVEAYKANAYYAASKEIVPIGATANYMNIYTEYTLTDASKLPADVTIGTRYMYYPNPDWRKNYGYEGDLFGHLTVATPGAINIGTLDMSQDFYVVRGYKYGTSVIAKSAINANRMVTRIYLQNKDWNFICLPYDIKVSDIECSDRTQWTVRRYSGSDRAKMTNNTWITAKANDILKAGEGFILHFTNPDLKTGELMYEEFIFPSSQPVSFKDEDAVVSLKEFDSEFAHNRSWNLVGNMYPSYYYTPELNHDGIITVWENGLGGGKYVSYSLIDDSYVLHPNEAFFVQRQPDADKLTFVKTGRLLSPEASMERKARARTRAMNASDRQIYNLILTDGTSADRTRLVVNPNASEQYELNRDASKMMTDNALQFYLNDCGQAMSIDERPMPAAEIDLGMVLPQSGRYTIEVAEHQSQKCNVILTDRQTGENINLNNGSYSFVGEKGSLSSRFAISVTERGLTSIPSDDYDPEVPGNPGANYFDPVSGLLIIDDYSQGLFGNVWNALLGGNEEKVKILRLGGNLNKFYYHKSLRNLTEIDLSRTGGSGLLKNIFARHEHLTKVSIPAGIDSLGTRIFDGCAKLSEITCFAVTPPVTVVARDDYYNTFAGIPEGVVAKVPKNSVSLYKAAPGWKDLIIVPMTDKESYSITVNLPDDATSGRYYGMTLVLENLTNQTQVKYVMSDKKQYEFVSLPANSAYNVCIKTLQGAEIVRMDGIQIEKENVTVTLTGMLQSYDLSLSITDSAGKDQSAQCTITWFDSKGEYVGRGASLMGVVEGSKYSYTVGLPEALALQYVAPAKTDVTVSSATSKLFCTLTSAKSVAYKGRVLDAEDGRPVYGVSVTLVQEINGLQKTVGTSTDVKGEYMLEGINLSGRLTFASGNYRTVEQDISATDRTSITIEDINMEVLNGTIIFANLSGYESHTDVTYTLYNNTRGNAITDFFVQGTQIVADPKLTAMDEIRVTASSKSKAFEPVSDVCIVVEDEPLSITLPIVKHGAITSHYEKCSKTVDIVGMLYNANREMIASGLYDNAEVSFGNLQAGTYTLVTMMKHNLYNSVLKYEELNSLGLKSGSDYVVNQALVTDGDEVQILIDEVPVLEDGQVQYLTPDSYVTISSSELTVGNYVTLSAKPVFKAEVADKIKDIKLIVDIPRSCSMVYGSVLTAQGISDYTLDNNRLIIPMNDLSAPARFCVVSGIAGDYLASVSVEFSLNGEKQQQMLGSAKYRYETYGIKAPETTVSDVVRVLGFAPAMAPVKVYDDDVLIGETYANGNGTWSLSCRLNKPYNLSVHKLKAVISTENGIDIETDVAQCKINKNGNAVKTITMSLYNSFYNKVTNVVFDQENANTSVKNYRVPSSCDFTFAVNLVNNSPSRVSGVSVNVFLSDNTIETLKAEYDKKTDRWVAKKFYDINDPLPINLSADFAEKEVQVIGERKQLDAHLNEMLTYAQVLSEIREDYAKSLAAIPEPEIYEPKVEDSKAPTAEQLTEWAAAGYETFVAKTKEASTELEAEYKKWLDEHEAFENETNATLAAMDELYSNYADTILAELRLEVGDYKETFDARSTNRFSGNAIISQSPITSSVIVGLQAQGYQKCLLNDGSELWSKSDASGTSLIDTKKMMRYDLKLPESGNEASTRAAVTLTGFFDGITDPKLTQSQSAWMNCASFMSRIGMTIAAIQAEAEEDTWINISKFTAQVLPTCQDAVKCAVTGFAAFCNAVMDAVIKNNEKQNAKNVSKLSEKLGKTQKSIQNNIALYERYQSEMNVAKQFIGDAQAGAKWQQRYNELSAACSDLVKSRTVDQNIAKNLEKQIDVAKNSTSWLVELVKNKLGWAKGFNFDSWLGSFAKGWNKFGKFMGAIGILCAGYDAWVTFDNCLKDLTPWQDLKALLDQLKPCPDDKENFDALVKEVEREAKGTLIGYASTIAAQLGGISADIVGLATLEFPPAEFWSFIVSAILNSGASLTNTLYLEPQRNKIGEFSMRIMDLKCFRSALRNKKRLWIKDSITPFIQVGRDPSGYVYEAVPDNRLEGVTATCFYRDENNMARLWDAEEFDQKNPLLTDENGFYQWFVPDGTWMVKYEKTGYETTYSDWLPVPPPQLEVNVGMKRLIPPGVQYVEAHSTGIDIYFDTHMIIDAVSEAGNVSVVANNRVVSGTVTLLEGNGTTSDAFRFVPDAEITDDTKVVVTVSKRVQSYTGLQMGSDYQQTFTIDPTAIDEVEADESASTVSGTSRLYDILGRAVRRLTTDQYVIQDGKVIVVE